MANTLQFNASNLTAQARGLLAGAVARVRRLGANGERGVDAITGLLDADGLAARLRRPGMAGKAAAVAVFDCSDLAEIRDIYGSKVALAMGRRVARKLRQVAGERGFAARTGHAEFTVVLPGAGRERVLAAVQQAFGMPSRVEYESGDSEIMVVPDVLIGVAGVDEDLAGLQAALSRRLAWDRAYEQRRRDWLRRERERHSRPQELAAA